MNSFVENENKELLWSILYDQGVFGNIPSELFDNVKSLFESEIVNVANTYKHKHIHDHDRELSTESLVILNKEVIQQLSEKIARLRQQIINKPAVLSKDIQNERIDKFNKNLENMQSEFSDMIKEKKPEEPIFSEQKDEPFDKINMDALLQKIVNERNLEMNNVVQNVGAPENDDSSNPPILNIGPKIDYNYNITDIHNNNNMSSTDNLTNQQLSKPKHVTFEIDTEKTEPTSENDKFFDINLNGDSIKDIFLNKLKKSTKIVDNEYESERIFNESLQVELSTTESINKLLANQSKLLELFNTINSKQNMILEKINILEARQSNTNAILDPN